MNINPGPSCLRLCLYAWSPADGCLVLADQTTHWHAAGTPAWALVYTVQDAAGNLTAAVMVTMVGTATEAKLAERYVYDPYGNPTVLAAEWPRMDACREPPGSAFP